MKNNFKRALVTGCAGFIGSNLVESLLDKNYIITGVDNFRKGKKKFITKNLVKKNFKFIKIDLLNKNDLGRLFKQKFDIVFHFAANADVRKGHLNPLNDLKYNTIMTSKLLEECRKSKIKRFVFCSTGSIYGETRVIPTPENVNFPIQTSMYGASKLACEGLIQAYSEAYGLKSYIYRFVSILGPNYSHGHVIDFYKKLYKNKNILKVLGDGNQRKSYLHVNDCINAILLTIKKSKNKINIFNLGTNETITVKESVKLICKNLNLDPEINFLGGKRGWVGDVPHIHLKINKIKKMGWKPKYTIKQSILDTLDYLKNEN